jgi:cardiolipin synthase
MTHLPNAISFGRLLSVPVVLFLLWRGFMVGAFWVFVAASLSDAIDGYLARKFDFRSRLGVYLDPLADKILLISVFLMLGYLEEVPLFLLLSVISRDLLIFFAIFQLHRSIGDDLGSPIFISKIHTLLQMFFITLILGKLAFNLRISETFLSGLGYAVFLTTILSAMEYIKIWRKLLKKR